MVTLFSCHTANSHSAHQTISLLSKKKILLWCTQVL